MWYVLALMAGGLVVYVVARAFERAKQREFKLKYELEVQKAERRRDSMRDVPLDELVRRANERAKLERAKSGGRGDPKKG